jgi:hypothetical protein
MMRVYHKLDRVVPGETSDTLLIQCSEGPDCQPELWLGREGLYVSISATYGPLEVALRPHLRDLTSSLAQLRPVERLSATRMFGTGQAQIELGLSTEGELLFRPVIVADATGHLAVNMILTQDARARLFEWLGVAGPG